LRVVSGDHLPVMSLDIIAIGREEEGLLAAARSRQKYCINLLILSMNGEMLCGPNREPSRLAFPDGG
jgi:hypothetical protein